MEKDKENKGEVKLNDELLDQVSGGGYSGSSTPLRCSNCGYVADHPKYSPGVECPLCHNGVFY